MNDIGKLAQEHACPDAAKGHIGQQWVWTVDRIRRTSVDQCQWCAEQFPRDEGETEFFIWSLGYQAAKGDATAVLMRMPTPDTPGSWRNANPSPRIDEALEAVRAARGEVQG
jgi:hypothetical protein